MWIRPLLPNPPDFLSKIICKIRTCIFCDDSAALFNSLETGGFSAHPDRFTVRRKEKNEKNLEKNGNTASGSSGVSHAVIVEKPGGCSKATEAETQCSKGISAAGEKDHLKSQSSTPATASKVCFGGLLIRKSHPWIKKGGWQRKNRALQKLQQQAEATGKRKPCVG